jgi:hypothetical protein
LDNTLAGDIEIARRFQSAAEDGLRTGDFGPLAGLVAPDVELVMPQHTLSGVEAMTEELGRSGASETLEVEFESGEWKSLGEGRYDCEIRALYRSKATGEPSYSRDRSFGLTIRAGKVIRCEMRFAD